MQKYIFRKKSILFTLPFLVGACNMAPKDYTLDIPVPTEWRVEGNPYLNEEESATYANVLWWEKFGDPVLDELIAEALQNNKELLVATWRVVEFQALYRFVTGNLYPQINARGSYLREQISIAQNPLPKGVSRYRNTFALAFEGFFEIDIWGRLQNLSRAALAEYLSKENARRNVVISVTGSVATSYIRLRQVDKQLQIAKKTLASRLSALELAKVRFENGYTSELEVKQAASTVSDAQATINRMTVDNNVEENLLSFLVGRNSGDIVRGPELSQLQLVPEIPVGLPSALLGRRPDILEAEENLIGANELVGAARAAFFPNISLTGALGVISPEFKNLFSGDATFWNYGGSFLQTIFDGYRLCAKLDAAIAFKEETFYEYERVIQNAFREVNDALIAHQLSLELLKIEKQRLQELLDYLELARLQYANGHVDYLNVLDAERGSFDAELDVVAAESNMFITLINLYTALGGGWLVDTTNNDTDDCLLINEEQDMKNDKKGTGR
jgi:multidrug efflux system outer membrane protein